jgi:hypothetical protein
MSCCGQRRAQQRNTASAFAHEHKAPRASAGRLPVGAAYFEYNGATAITVVGGVTRRQYRFAAPGVPVEVDARDRPSLARVPLLREVPLIMA